VAITPSSQNSKITINIPKPEHFKLEPSISEPSTPQEISLPKSEEMKLRKKSSSSRLFGKVLRVASNRNDPTPTAKKPSHKWRTGGGRHPLVVDRAAKAQKVQAIEAVMNGLSLEDSVNPELGLISDHDDRDDVHKQTFRDDDLPAYHDLPSIQVSTQNPTNSESCHAIENVPKIHYLDVPLQPPHDLFVMPGATHTTHVSQMLRPTRPSPVNGFHRSVHAVSTSTDHDIRTIAEMLSPLLIEKSEPSVDPRNDDWAIGDDDDSVIEPTIHQGPDTLSPLSTKFNVAFR
jgi:hypothetical protein